MKGTYMDTQMGMIRQEERVTRAGDELNNAWLNVDLDKVIEKVIKRSKTMSSFLSKGLSERVYSNDEIILISNCRRLLDLRSVMNQVAERVHINVSSITLKSFTAAAISLEHNLETRLEENELRTQFRLFNAKLEEMAREKGSYKLDSLKILGKFLDPKFELYR